MTIRPPTTPPPHIDRDLDRRLAPGDAFHRLIDQIVAAERPDDEAACAATELARPLLPARAAKEITDARIHQANA